MHYSRGLPITTSLVVAFLIGCASVQTDWEKAKTRNSVYGYTFFLREHPTGEYSAEARKILAEMDTKAYAEALHIDTVDAYAGYLLRFSDSSNAAKATQRRQALEASQTIVRQSDPGRAVIVARLLSVSGNALTLEVNTAGGFTFVDSTKDDFDFPAGARIERVTLQLASSTKICANQRQVPDASALPTQKAVTLVVPRPVVLLEKPAIEVHAGLPTTGIELSRGVASFSSITPPCLRP